MFFMQPAVVNEAVAVAVDRPLSAEVRMAERRAPGLPRWTDWTATMLAEGSAGDTPTGMGNGTTTDGTAPSTSAPSTPPGTATPGEENGSTPGTEPTPPAPAAPDNKIDHPSSSTFPGARQASQPGSPESSSR